jgi:hypothetical protein
MRSGGYTIPRLRALITLWVTAQSVAGLDMSRFSGARLLNSAKRAAAATRFDDPIAQAMADESPAPLRRLVDADVTERTVRRVWLPILRDLPHGIPTSDALADVFIRTCRHAELDR